MPQIDEYFGSVSQADDRRQTRSSARTSSIFTPEPFSTQPTQPVAPREPYELPVDSSMSSVAVVDLDELDTSPEASQSNRKGRARALSPPEDLGLDFGEDLHIHVDSSPPFPDPPNSDCHQSIHGSMDCTRYADGSKTVKTSQGLIRVPAKFNGEAPARFQFDCRWYRVAGTDEQKLRTSEIYAYGQVIVQEETKGVHWLCGCCITRGKKSIYASAGTRSIRKHLRQKHGVKFKNDGTNSPDIVPSEKPSNGQGYLAGFTGGIQHFKMLFLLFFLMCNLSLYQIENVYFRDLLSCMNLQMFNFMPRASSTIRRWIMDEFRERKGGLKESFRTARSKVSISFDLWTSPNCRALMAVCGHFIDNKGCRRHTLIALRPIYGAHTADNIAEVLGSVLREYGLDKVSRFGWVVSDNAIVNDRIIDLVLKDLMPSWTSRERRQRWIRCFGHVVNIGAQRFLHGMKSDQVMDQMEEARQSGDTERIADLWRQIGAMGILHNLIRYIRMTPQRRGEFAGCVVGDPVFDQLGLISATQTRWNSAYMALTRAINLRPRLNSFQSTHRPDARSRVKFEPLNATHWDTLERIHSALEPFYDVTLESEGFKDDLSGYVQCLDYLHKCISQSEEDWRTMYEDYSLPEHKALSEAANDSWLALEDYYNKCDQSPAYYAAMAINPSLKWQWCIETWGSDSEKQDWLPPIQKQVHDFWTSQYKGKIYQDTTLSITNTSDPPITSECSVKRKRQHGSERSAEELREYKRVKSFDPRYVDAFEQYIQQPLEASGVDPLAWWNVRWVAGPNRDLAQMALDLLAIPSMSSECERVFSQCKILITDRRNRLNDDIVEACECLRYWMTDKGKVNAFDADSEGFDGVDADFIDDIPGFGEEPDERLLADE